MVEVTYQGPHNAVDLEVGPNKFVTVANGETVSVPDKVANGDPAQNTSGLLAQPSNWVKVSKPAPKSDKS